MDEKRANFTTMDEELLHYLVVMYCILTSGRIPCPHPGRIWLEQRGLQRALYWHIEARVVLDLQEFHLSVSSVFTVDSVFFLCIYITIFVQDNDRELHFFMVDGDFKKFEGKWSVKSRKGYVFSWIDCRTNITSIL